MCKNKPPKYLHLQKSCYFFILDSFMVSTTRIKYTCWERLLMANWAQIYKQSLIVFVKQGPQMLSVLPGKLALSCKPPALCSCLLSPSLWTSSWNHISTNSTEIFGIQSEVYGRSHLHLYKPIRASPFQPIKIVFYGTLRLKI